MFRHGQWILCKVADGLAAQLREAGAYEYLGWFVGIHSFVTVGGTGYRTDSLDDTTEHIVRITPVNAKGENVVKHTGKDRRGRQVPVHFALAPGLLTEVKPLVDKKQLPPGRVVAKDWQPQA